MVNVMGADDLVRLISSSIIQYDIVEEYIMLQLDYWAWLTANFRILDSWH